MFNLKDNNILKFFTAFSLIVMLTACSSSNDGELIVFDPDVAPQNVQVVSGDGFDSEVQNIISWTRDPADPDYVVYVGNTPDVTESSSVVVPSAHGFNYVTHSGVDVVAGSAYYYRVQAQSGGQSSILSDEVTGTPQLSITSKQLNDVAWNGTDTLITVGEAGVILNSPNGLAVGWTDVSDVVNTPESLTGVTWESTNNQFLIVGAGLTVLTGDGNTWSREDLSNLEGTTDLEDVAWLGDGYIAVGKNCIIITSPDGSDWTRRDSGLSVPGTTLNGVASNDNNLIVVVGTNGTLLTSTDNGLNWQQQLLPAVVDTRSLNDITWDGKQFGVVGSNDTILSSSDGIDWTLHNPGTSYITFVAASQWDSLLPINPALNPVLGAVGSSGTFVVSPDAVTGFSIPTGTNERLSGMTWVDDGQLTPTPPYFVIVGNDGTVLTSQLQ